MHSTTSRVNAVAVAEKQKDKDLNRETKKKCQYLNMSLIS